MTIRLLTCVALSLALNACKSKKSAPVPVVQAPAEELDTVHVVASRLPVKKVYRASNPLPNDLLHTKLEVNFDWPKSRMNGRATLRVKPRINPVSELALNARGMEIRTLEVFEVVPPPADQKAGKDKKEPVEDLRKLPAATFVQRNDSLIISFGRKFFRQEHYYVVIDYTAKPNELSGAGGSAAITDNKGLYFINPTGENPYKMTQLWTQGETQSSSVWFPTIDSPNEKMTQEILMSVDDKYVTLSNGMLVSSVKQAGGTRLDHWKQDQPHAPYLAMMAVGEFVKVVDEPWNGKEISYYVEKEYADHAKAIFGETREMIEFYSSKLGVPYEWGKYAQIAARDYVSGAMENTSATLHGDFMVYQTAKEMKDGRRATAVIAHELFHQWFGDLVTSESWSNLPLNESFATYGEYLWEEYKNGRDAADEHGWQSKLGYLHSQKEVDLIRFEYEDKEDMFDAFSYNKGGQVLHMLRKAVGDEAFFASLNKYLLDNKFKPVEIHHLRLAFEEVTGTDMNWFFNQWFLNKGRPSLEVKKTYDAGNLRLIVKQKQDFAVAPLYRLPLEVDIYHSNTLQRAHIVIDDITDTFNIKVAAQPELVNFDAERQLLADVEFEKSEKELLFQYDNAPLFGDRMEVIQRFEKRINDSTGFYFLCRAATRDRNATIRKYAIGRIEKSAPSFSAGLKSTLTQVFLGDTFAPVRALALGALNRRFMNDPEVLNLTMQGLSQESYAVNAEALNAIMKRDPQQALNEARKFEKEKGKDIILTLAGLYGQHGSDAQVKYFRESVRYVNGFDMLLFCSSYSKLAQRCNEAANVLMAAQDLELIGKGASKYTKFATSKAIKDLVAGFESKETVLRKKIETDRAGGKSVTEAEKQAQAYAETRTALKAIYERTRS